MKSQIFYISINQLSQGQNNMLWQYCNNFLLYITFQSPSPVTLTYSYFQMNSERAMKAHLLIAHCSVSPSNSAASKDTGSL